MMVDATADKENVSYRMQMIQPETRWAANRRDRESAKRRWEKFGILILHGWTPSAKKQRFS